jgi:kelch-like protein 17 (actinfilin)/kelch-like protein 20
MAGLSGSTYLAATGGKVYAVGSIGAEVFDPATGTWSPIADLNQPRTPGGVIALDGKVYAIGGTVSSSLVATVEAYDPNSDLWNQAAPLPVPRTSIGVATLGGKIYAFGGNSAGQNFSARVDEYDPATNTWQQKPNMPVGRTALAATTGDDGRIYVMAGAYFSGSETDTSRQTVHQYDPTSGTWRACLDLLAPRWALAAAATEGKVYAIGGVRLNTSTGVYTAFDTLMEGTLPVCP